MTLRVLHLVGSEVSDFHCDLSRLYASDCLESTADPMLYEFHIAYVTPDRRWRFPQGLDGSAIQAAPPMPLSEAVQRIVALDIDVMVPQMFCVPGVTRYRALFELLGIPYVGNTSDAMALTANKARARAVVAQAGVRVPRGQVVGRGECSSLDLPVVVKPVDADNSLGVTLVTHRGELGAALDAAWSHADEALVESYVPLGREVRCGLLEREGRLVGLPLEEYAVDSATKPIRRTGDKLDRRSDGQLRLVAKDPTRAWIVEVDDSVTRKVWDAARACHVALGCRDYSLFDFRIDPDGEPWFLEAGLYCSFARTSVVAVMAEAAGIPLRQMFDDALTQSIAARPEHRSTIEEAS